MSCDARTHECAACRCPRQIQGQRVVACGQRAGAYIPSRGRVGSVVKPALLPLLGGQEEPLGAAELEGAGVVTFAAGDDTPLQRSVAGEIAERSGTATIYKFVNNNKQPHAIKLMFMPKLG